MVPVRLRRVVWVALILGLVCTVPVLGQGGPFSSQIENFWRLIANGGRGFTTIAMGPSAGTVLSSATPSISAGFGSVKSIGTGSNTASWVVNITTSGGATTGSLTLPAAANGWACWASDLSHPNDSTIQTGGATNRVDFTTTIAWSDGDVITGGCMGH